MANGTRVIRYVGVLGYRMDSYTLVDMRVHDINVVTDLNEQDPNSSTPPPTRNPPHGTTQPTIKNDGTGSGYTPTAEAVSFVDMLVEMATSGTQSWWTGWWPVLHSRTSGTLDSGATYAYQVGVDLLGSIVLEAFSVNTPMDDSLSDTDIYTLTERGFNEFLEEAFPIESVLLLVAVVLMGVIDIMLNLITKVPTPNQMIALAALIAGYTGAMLIGLSFLWDGILVRRHSAAAAFGVLAALLASLCIEGILASINAMKIINAWWNHYKAGFKKETFARRFCIISFLIVAIKVFLIGVILGMMVRSWELWLLGY